jgi:hypothetical protein
VWGERPCSDATTIAGSNRPHRKITDETVSIFLPDQSAVSENFNTAIRMTRGTLNLCVGPLAPAEPAYSRRKIASGHVSQFRLERLGTPSNHPSAAPTDILERQHRDQSLVILAGDVGHAGLEMSRSNTSHGATRKFCLAAT